MPTNKNSILNQRHAGILLHISSLPSKGYIGDLGEDAERMVDVLAEMGVSVWQTLPINMPHSDHSPYQCISAFAGNSEFISLEQLAAQDLLSLSDITDFYAGDYRNKAALLAQAHAQFIATQDQTPFITFCQQEANWLNDFALFLALRNQFNQQSWQSWPAPYKNRDEVTLTAARMNLACEIAVIQFTQFIFFSQWKRFKTYALSKSVHLFGDIPIFVAYDSAEVWANPHLFKLDAEKNMSVVAGVPPDYFSETGQRWGNPHYQWEKMAEDGYAWWVARLAKQSALFDLVRIDHFRGLEAAWEIASTEETAMNGQWVLAPGDALLAAIYQQLPDIHLVAEDLGIITPEVDALRLKYEMPGMKILQFAFGGDDTNPYLPQNIDENSVVYTGTHDNDTTLGWYNQAEPHVKAHLQHYLNSVNQKNESQENFNQENCNQDHLNQENQAMPQALIQMALASPAYLAVIPMQDVLGLDSDCRMNTPGTIVNNWLWRFDWQQLTAQHVSAFKDSVSLSGRAPHA